MNFIKINDYFISRNHCNNYKLDLWQYKNCRVCLLESETREWFKCVDHLKNTSTLDCAQTFYFIMWSLYASTCFVSKNQHFGELKSAVSVPTVPTLPNEPTVPTVPQLYLCLYRLYLDCIYISVLIVFWLYLFLYTDCTSLYYNCTTDY